MSDVRWSTRLTAWQAASEGVYQVFGPIWQWTLLVNGDGTLAAQKWANETGLDGSTSTFVAQQYAVYTAVTDFLACRNVEIVEPTRPRAEQRRIARTGVHVSEIAVFPGGHGQSFPFRTRRRHAVDLGAWPLP